MSIEICFELRLRFQRATHSVDPHIPSSPFSPRDTVIVLLTNDLMFQSKVSGAVRNAGKQLIVDRSVERVIERAEANAVKLVLIDLSLQTLDLEKAIRSLHDEFGNASVLAFGAHVDVARLDEASRAGADSVLTRGQFDRDLNEIVQSV